MTLREIWDRHSCDKGSRHGYEAVYEPILSARRTEALSVLEIGVFRGASIASWLEYLPNASIVAVDTFERIPAGQVKALNHPHVTTVKGDSMTIDLSGYGPFDLIADDGDHRPSSQAATFRNLFPLLREGGYYVIEDVFPWTPATRALPWIQARPLDYNDDAWDDLTSTVRCYTTIAHDYRHGQQPDSFAISIRK